MHKLGTCLLYLGMSSAVLLSATNEFSADGVKRFELSDLLIWAGCCGDGSRPREQLAAESAAILRHLAVKDRVTADVIAGRETLLGAAARFRAAVQDWPGYRPFPDGNAEGLSPDEAYCRQVICYVRNLRTAAADGMAGRLEEELDRRRERGALRLPPAE